MKIYFIKNIILAAIYYFLIVLTSLFVYDNQLDSSYQNYIGKKITRIDFSGNKFTSNLDLLDLIYARPGLILTKKMVNEDIKKIYANGAFSNVYLIAQNYKRGVKIKFVINERLYIKSIEFKGLDELIEKDVKEAILFEEESIYDEKLISESIEILKLKYEEKGFFNAIIKTKVKFIKNNTALNLIFLVDEGEEIKISKIKVLGTKTLDPEKIIDSIELEEDGIISDGKFQRNLFEADKRQIIDYMRSEGYLDAELIKASWLIKWADKKKDVRGIEITFEIKEGDQYFFDGYEIEWNKERLNQDIKKPLYNKNQFYKIFEYTDSDIGDIYNHSKIKNDSNVINQLYSREGYIFTRVQPITTTIILNKKELAKWKNSAIQKKNIQKGIDYYRLKILENILKTEPKTEGRKYIHTKFIISEGDKGYIENIIIKGNEKTHTEVIRREILLTEGDLFNAALVQRSRERIFNLGFFKEVGLDIRPGSGPKKLDLVIDIKEQPTGNISLGGGYGTQAGFTIFTELAENNLNGKGQRISGKLDLGPSRILINTSWREPWLFNRPWSLSLSLAYSDDTLTSRISTIGIQDKNETYQIESFGFATQVNHQFAIFWGHFHGWLPSIQRTHNPSSLASDSLYALVNQGWRFSNKVRNGIFYDDRDNIRNPTSGMRAEFHITMVGSIFAGNDHFIQYQPTYLLYWWPADFTFGGLFRKSTLRRWRFVFEHRISLGFTQITGPIYNKQLRTEDPYIQPANNFYLGGYESLRGWSPNDSDYEIAWRDRASHRIIFGSELRIPILPNILSFVFFFEGGALFEDVKNALIDYRPIGDFGTKETLNSIRNSGLVAENFRADYFKYSWGFGFRLQIPIFPIRFYLAKKVIWDTNLNFFREIPNQSFQIVFGIGDQRF